MHDLVIRGGRVVDGTGAPARTADLAVDGDRIAEVGRVAGRGRREIDADGALVAPGWVDIHTHYDGQAIWDAEMAPSADHGVTTAVMGNCGVGFAPVRPGSEDFLVEVMEAVEDIPGTALHEGIDWQWETFGEYLDALASMPRTIDLGTQVPHAAVRTYVLGERAHEDELTVEEHGRIAEVVADGVRSGALGFSTSRTILHRSKHGYVPGTFALDDELSVIADALQGVGRGLFQFVSDNRPELPDREVIESLSRRGIDVTYSMAQTPFAPDAFRDSLADAARINDVGGARIAPQVPARPTGMLFGLRSSFHPFVAHPTFRTIADLPFDQLVSRLRQPEVRDALLAEQPRTRQKSAEFLATAWHQMYRLGVEPDYEPTRESSALATAEREQRDPQAVVLDWLLEDEGDALLFSPLGSYVDHDHEAIREMILHPSSILGLSDGGAHCGLICDASFPTYLLTHWTRDRTRGELIPVEHVVHKQTQATAVAYGMTDRGVLAPGLLADVNVIDHAGLRLHRPRMVHDLPAGGRRLLQDVDGYRVTIKAGEATFVDGEITDARPGRTLRATDAGVIRT
jgi:N-acyl-D-aspartate/D-glutamate deacylase